MVKISGSGKVSIAYTTFAVIGWSAAIFEFPYVGVMFLTASLTVANWWIFKWMGR